ncbi:MAG: HPr family phosphocarrier protein [Verrucomicrobiota bacterium]|nr:HPr family phosphocarrier protein [Verrucomicrobiota bacterium]
MSPEPGKPSTEKDVLKKDVTVLNRYGIHARPAALLVKAATRFSCEILIEKNGVKVNAKSIMGLLTLEGNHGAHLVLSASGENAAEALEALSDLFEKKFFED